MSCDNEFTRGFVCAVANLVKMHDEPTIAKDLLRCIGNVDWKTIDRYDRDILRRAGLLKSETK